MKRELCCALGEDLLNIAQTYPYFPEGTRYFAVLLADGLKGPAGPRAVAEAIVKLHGNLKHGKDLSGRTVQHYLLSNDKIRADAKFVLQIIDDMTTVEFSQEVRRLAQEKLGWKPFVFHNPSRLPPTMNKNAAMAADWWITKMFLHEHNEDIGLNGLSWDEVHDLKSRFIQAINCATCHLDGTYIYTGESYPEWIYDGYNIGMAFASRANLLPQDMIMHVSLSQVTISDDKGQSFVAIH